MSSELLEEATVTLTYVYVKFYHSLKASEITNDKITVATNASTPVVITSPFDDIDLLEDYNSISKTLTLRWASSSSGNVNKLEPNTTYNITFSGFVTTYGAIIDDHVVTFTTGDQTIPDSEELVPKDDPVTVIDNTVRRLIFSSSVSPGSFILSGSSSSFKVESFDPIDGEYYLEPDYLNGRMVVEFSFRPKDEFLMSPYIKVQRKEIKRGPVRWEPVNAMISIDDHYPWVYIDLPSIDHYPEAATPSSDVVYRESGYYYYEKNYKYRVILSRDISV